MRLQQRAGRVTMVKDLSKGIPKSDPKRISEQKKMSRWVEITSDTPQGFQDL